jgi:hypothetical protein
MPYHAYSIYWSALLRKKRVHIFILSQHPPQFLDREKGDKSNKHDHNIGDKFMGALPQERNGVCRETSPLPKAFDPILKNGKDPEKESEDGGLVL